MVLWQGSGRRKKKISSLPNIARLNTMVSQVFRPFATTSGREPETRVQIPAGAPFLKFKCQPKLTPRFFKGSFALLSASLFTYCISSSMLCKDVFRQMRQMKQTKKKKRVLTYSYVRLISTIADSAVAIIANIIVVRT